MRDHITIVACAVIYKNGKILAAQRSETMHLPLKWEFPGGKVEKDETIEACLHRELMEELNISIVIRKQLESFVSELENKKIKFIPFLADYRSGEMRLKEHKDAILLEEENIESLDWADGDKEIVRQLLSFNKTVKKPLQ